MLKNTAKISRNARGNILEKNLPVNDEKTWQKGSHFGTLSYIWLAKRVLKGRFLESCLTNFSTFCNFGNTFATRIIFLYKMLKIWCRFQKCKNKLRKSFRFSDNCIWFGSFTFSHSWTGYLHPAVLTNTPKISRGSMGDIFEINFNENDEKTWQKCSHGDFESIWGAFPCWLSMTVLKQRFLESGLINIFTVPNYRKYISHDYHPFFQNVSNLIQSPEMEQKVEKKLFVFGIIAFALGVANSHNLEQDTWYS